MNGSRTWQEVLDDYLEDSTVRRDWERTEVARTIAIWLCRYRADHGLTQAELAAKAGMKQSAIARLEAGETTPALVTVQRLAKALGVDLVLRVSADPQAGPAIVISEAA